MMESPNSSSLVSAEMAVVLELALPVADRRMPALQAPSAASSSATNLTRSEPVLELPRPDLFVARPEVVEAPSSSPNSDRLPAPAPRAGKTLAQLFEVPPSSSHCHHLAALPEVAEVAC